MAVVGGHGQFSLLVCQARGLAEATGNIVLRTLVLGVGKDVFGIAIFDQNTEMEKCGPLAHPRRLCIEWVTMTMV